jgi:hypothetical protein
MAWEETSAWVREMTQQLQTVYGLLHQQTQALDYTFRQTQETLHIWQEQAGASDSGSMFWGLWGWILGRGGPLSIPQAIRLWNSREQTALVRAAHHAALQGISRVLDSLNRLEETQTRTRDRILYLRDQAKQYLEHVQQNLGTIRPVLWTWHGDPHTIARLLAQPPVDYAGVAPVAEALTAGADEASLWSLVTTLAQQEALRRLEGQDCVQLIALEGQHHPVDGTDPVVVVGQFLLNRLNRSLPWLLEPTVRPRTETLQVTPAGDTIYSLAGLHTAACGPLQDCLAFVHIEIDVAYDELQLSQGNPEDFQDFQQRRNGYVLEELAQEVPEYGDARESSHDASPRPNNGQVPTSMA